MRPEHFNGLQAAATDESNWRYMVRGFATPDDLRSWVDAALQLEAAGTAMPWVTVVRSDGRVVGSTRFADIDREHRTAELGWTWLAPEMRGTGVNAEVKLLQLRHGFEAMGLRRIAFKTHHENEASKAALRKLGAVEEGTFRNHYIMPDGSARHSVWFSITAQDWPEVRLRLEARLAGVSGNQPRPYV